ncbi:nuclear transport factor 2 family protein [Nocardioides stalactiti]|uniref:nuclear transport factor 2 family protein n=1 Tax=Nocardioides stalactiti TaxID=2755356 RepID=UPI001603CA3E|nr:nuclear transport factor 2 family protein [Nocardioides stalactiti]
MRTDRRAAAIGVLVATRDLDGLGRHLTEDVRLRALLPGGPVEHHGRDEALKRFDEWFGDRESVALEEADGELVGDRLLVHYRLRFEPSPDQAQDQGPARVLTQTWVASIDEAGLIFRVDLVCSGFREVV